jgi:hypothetical protein
MRLLSTLLFLALTNTLYGQNMIEWSKDYQLQLSDFQSPATEIGTGNMFSLNTGAGLDFSFYMTNAEFMFTKNFNSKVNCVFNRSAAALVAPDSLYANDLLHFARYQFDLSELYARKLRKKLYEEKGTFSSISFFQPVYDQIQRDFTEQYTQAGKATDLGHNKEKLEELHKEVLREIDTLSEFCKDCKPIKKKK